jgi:hypothetical protein
VQDVRSDREGTPRAYPLGREVVKDIRRAVGPLEVLLLPRNPHRLHAVVHNAGQDALHVFFGEGADREERRLRQFESVDCSMPHGVFIGPISVVREGGSYGPVCALEESSR